MGDTGSKARRRSSEPERVAYPRGATDALLALSCRDRRGHLDMDMASATCEQNEGSSSGASMARWRAGVGKTLVKTPWSEHVVLRVDWKIMAEKRLLLAIMC